jgi:hypothetical protein
VDPEEYFDPAEYVDELLKTPQVHLTWSDDADLARTPIARPCPDPIP